MQAEDELLRRIEKSVGVQMKLSLTFLMIVFLILGTVACTGSITAEKGAKDSTDPSSALSQVVLEVPTIWCWTCEPRVAASAKSVPGVKAVEFDGQTVTVTYDPEQTTPDAIVKAIERGGDRVTKVTEL